MDLLVWWARHMVISPHHIFLAQGTPSNSRITSLDNALGNNALLISDDITAQNNRQTTKENYMKHYKQCKTCYDFSMLFGGLIVNGRVLTSEEEFEVAKGEFVQHFNENHRELVQRTPIIKKYTKIGENKKSRPVREPVYLTQEMYRSLLMDENMYRIMTADVRDRAPEIRRVYGTSVFASRTADRLEARRARHAEVRAQRNIDNLDRNEQFRERMRRMP